VVLLVPFSKLNGGRTVTGFNDFSLQIIG